MTAEIQSEISGKLQRFLRQAELAGALCVLLQDGIKRQQQPEPLGTLCQVLLGQIRRQQRELVVARVALEEPEPATGPGQAATEQPEWIDPSEANSSWEWIGEVADKLGFTVTAVVMRYDKATLEKAGLRFEEIIGADLVEAGLGHYDSFRQGREFRLFYYLHTNNLPAGLEFLRGKLASLGLLDFCRIGTAEPAEKVWRQFYPVATES